MQILRQDPEKCRFPRCRRPVALEYLGAFLCQKHWADVAEETETEEGKLRIYKKLGIKFVPKRLTLNP